MKGVKLIAGTASRQLAEEVARNLGIHLVKADIGRFPNGEVRVQINESVRKHDIFIIQSIKLCPKGTE